MEMGMVGLGRMGGNMVLRLMKRGHRMIAFDRSADAVKAHEAQGAVGATSLKELVEKFEAKPRVIWVMVPAGDPTTQTINELVALGDPGDIIIDGGNTNWKLALEDAARVKAKGMHYMDAGTSGGVWGLANGYCLMVGCEESTYEHCLPLLKDLAPEEGGLVRTLTGAAVIVLLDKGLNLLGLSFYDQAIVVGAVVIVGSIGGKYLARPR